MISFGGFGTGKFLHERRSRECRNLKLPMSHERHIPIPVQVTIFPHDWLSRRTLIYFPNFHLVTVFEVVLLRYDI